VERDLARLGDQHAELAIERDRMHAEEASAAIDASSRLTRSVRVCRVVNTRSRPRAAQAAHAGER